MAESIATTFTNKESVEIPDGIFSAPSPEKTG
jgi:hypothetical protein